MFNYNSQGAEEGPEPSGRSSRSFHHEAPVRLSPRQACVTFSAGLWVLANAARCSAVPLHLPRAPSTLPSFVHTQRRTQTHTNTHTDTDTNIQIDTHRCTHRLGFPGGSDGEESACSAGDPGSIPGREGPLEEGMATHCSILTWRIPRTEEPGGP